VGDPSRALTIRVQNGRWHTYLVEAIDTLDFLLGRWRVERIVNDHRRGDQGQFRGVATFSRSESPNTAVGRVRFEEVGDYAIGDYRGEARRSLEYVASADSTVAITFVDGQHFIDLNLASGESSDEHLCNLDRYEITTVVKSRDLVEERWRVEGPEKDYDAIMSLERVTEDD
jgi:Family of unknown function (DUF6314)